jgi:outer membrane receptor protein involved in Fe transport
VAVDGLVGNDLGTPSIFGSTVNLDAIGEVKILLNNYQAEYGRNSGASINIITKSGTREFHGSAYWYVRNEDLNANDFFNNRNGLRRPLYRYNTQGFTIGGPLFIPKILPRKADKLFFFWSFEDDQTKNPQPLRTYMMPTALERKGDFSQSLDVNGRLIVIKDPSTGLPFPNNVIPTSRIDRNGQALLNVFPLPNALDTNVTKGTYNFLFQESLNVPKWNHLVRGDYRISDKDQMYVRANLWKSDQQGYAVAAGSANWGLTQQHYTFTDNGMVLDHTHVFTPSLVNEFSVGARHSVEKGPPISDAELGKVQKANTSFTLGQFYPQINPLGIIPQANFTGITNPPGISYDARYPLRGADTEFNVTDSLSWIHGRHNFKVGIFYDHGREYEGETATFAGNFSFARDANNPLDTGYTYANAALGNFTSYTESNSRPSTEGRFTSVSWFAQDTWKISRKLTLDYGVRFAWFQQEYQSSKLAAALSLDRYDRSKAPTFFRSTLQGGQRVGVNPITGEIVPAVYIGAFVPNTGNPSNGMVIEGDPNYPRGFIDQQRVLPEPRIGFAYDPFGDGKTAIRGGVGLFHNTRPTGSLLRNMDTYLKQI